MTRQDGGAVDGGKIREFFWDLAIVSHAFNRDKEPSWVCRNILLPLSDGLSVGGVLINVHAVAGGQVSELKETIFGDQFSFHTSPEGLVGALESALDPDRFQLLSHRQVTYRSHITGELFSSVKPWERELMLNQLAISVAYHLQIPDDAWVPYSDAIEAKIQRRLERDGRLEYALSIAGVKRRE